MTENKTTVAEINCKITADIVYEYNRMKICIKLEHNKLLVTYQADLHLPYGTTIFKQICYAQAEVYF